MEQASGYMITGFQAIVTLGVWAAVVLVYGVYRSLGRAEQDPPRPPGPLD